VFRIGHSSRRNDQFVIIPNGPLFRLERLNCNNSPNLPQPL
jgi:hypothetical protein